MRISDWSSDVCSSDLNHRVALKGGRCVPRERRGSNGDPGAGGIAMKLAYVDLCGFRGYRKRMRLDFAEDFTILDGRNGVGKSTIFDAVEFALTGHLSKYKDAKADGETVADYIWWAGNGPAPENRYVEAGFRSEEHTSELQSLMRRSYAVFCLKKKKTTRQH